MSFKTWKEYIDAKGKTIETAPEEEIPDYKGPDSDAPEKAILPKGPEGKEIDAPKATGAPSPYKNGVNAKDPNKTEKGLANTGDEKLVYEPNTKVDAKKLSSFAQKKTESFLNATKGMSNGEFLKYMLESCACEDMEEIPTVTAYTAGKFHPYPPEAIRYVLALAKSNPKVLENIIHEIKHSGLLGSTIEGIMDHPESYDHITSLLSDENGPIRAKALTNSMTDEYQSFMKNQDDLYESVAPPFGIHDSEEDLENADKPEEEEEDMDAPEDHDNNQPENDEEHPEEFDDVDSDSDNEKNSDEEQPEIQPKKLKKKFSHDHLLDAMHGVEHIREKMKGYFK